MVNSRAKVDVTSILSAHDAQRLRQACPDLDDWPRSWHYEPADIDVGQQIVAAFTPFLLHLLDRGLANTTVRRHRDNLWTLGGELVRLRYDDKKLARMDARTAIANLVDDECGPLIHPRISESEQDSLDATCRKLRKFMMASNAEDPQGAK
jgi:hypothetical protein